MDAHYFIFSIFMLLSSVEFAAAQKGAHACYIEQEWEGVTLCTQEEGVSAINNAYYVDSECLEVTECCPDYEVDLQGCMVDVEVKNTEYFLQLLNACDGKTECGVLDVRRTFLEECNLQTYSDYVLLNYTCKTDVTYRYYYECYQDAFIDPMCEAGTVILIDSAFFGLSDCPDTECCPNIEDPCQISVETNDPDYYLIIQSNCNGKQTCENLEARGIEVNEYCPGDDGMSDYVTLRYSCVEPLTKIISDVSSDDFIL